MRASPPVLLVVFNRPNVTARVFAAVRAARPAHLYVASDGPRAGKAGEVELVAAVRRIATMVDWPCEVRTRFLETNEGCGRAVSSAISWFLGEAGEGIILEDDCLPAPAFFEYAAAMLERYRDDERVGLISGTNMAPEVALADDYGFSSIVTCWGWATWRRTWARYRLVPEMIHPDEPWVRVFGGRSFRAIEQSFSRIRAGDIHTWDYQLLVQQLRDGQLTVIPRLNLVLNIGFDGAGTHFTSAQRPWWAPRDAFDFKGKWTRPAPVEAAKRFDQNYLSSSHAGGGKLARAWVKILRRYAHTRQALRTDRWDFEQLASLSVPAAPTSVGGASR